MTASNALGGEPAPFEWAIFADSLQSILRAGGGVATRRRGEGRDTALIEAYQADKGERYRALKALRQGFEECVLWHFR